MSHTQTRTQTNLSDNMLRFSKMARIGSVSRPTGMPKVTSILLVSISDSKLEEFPETSEPSNDSLVYVQSKRSTLYHKDKSCNSLSLSNIPIEVSTKSTKFNKLKPCKKCSMSNIMSTTLLGDTKHSVCEVYNDVVHNTNNYKRVFCCYDYEYGSTDIGTKDNVSVNMKTGTVECTCDAYEKGDVCAHMKFIIEKVTGNPKWLDALYEYGGLDVSQIGKFISEIDVATESFGISGRKCFACQNYIHGTQSAGVVESCGSTKNRRMYHKECMTILGL